MYGFQFMKVDITILYNSAELNDISSDCGTPDTIQCWMSSLWIPSSTLGFLHVLNFRLVVARSFAQMSFFEQPIVDHISILDFVCSVLGTLQHPKETTYLLSFLVNHHSILFLSRIISTITPKITLPLYTESYTLRLMLPISITQSTFSI